MNILSTENRHYVWLSLILILGIIFRFYGLSQSSVLQLEEITRLAFRHSSWLNMMQMADPVHMFSPLAVSIHYLFHQNYEGATLIIRQYSAIIGVLSIPMMYYLGRQLFDKNTGIIAAAFWAFSPWSVMLSRWASSYALFTLLLLATFAMVYKVFAELSARKGPEPLNWARFFILLALLSYVHPTGGWIAASIILGVLGYVIGHKASLTSSITLIILMITVNLPQILFLPGRNDVYTTDFMQNLSLESSMLGTYLSLLLLLGLVGILILVIAKIGKQVLDKKVELPQMNYEVLGLASFLGLAVLLLIFNGLISPITSLEFLIILLPLFILLIARSMSYMMELMNANWLSPIVLLIALAISTWLLI